MRRGACQPGRGVFPFPDVTPPGACACPGRLGSGGRPGEPSVVRLARRERDGAELTRVEELGLPPEALESWGQALQRGLACRATVEGEALVLAGDQRRGVRRVVQG